MIETLTPSEVAKSLKLHPFTVTRLAREGKLPAFKVGGVWQITLPLFPGRYEYQFYVDGQWYNDLKSAKRTPNLYGTENDVIEVPAS